MNKNVIKLGFIFLFLFSLSFFLIASVYSQIPQEAQSWACLKSKPSGKTENPLPPIANFTVNGEGFTTNDPQYIVICAWGSSRSYKCTTGDVDADQVVFNENMVSKGLLKGTSWKVTAPVPGPKQTPSGGSLSLKGVLQNPILRVGYNFWAVGFSTAPSTTPGPYEGSANTIQYGTFDFSTASSSGGLSKCVGMRWDPYGRVFDSQSLEPLPEVTIKLLDQNKKLVVKPGITNPDSTKVDGAFNFLVDPGTYYLSPIKANYTFSVTPNLNPNYVKAYSDIYKPDEPIVEVAGVAAHRDIPLDPGTHAPYTADPVLMDVTPTQLGDKTEYEGDVSHPLTIVILINKTTGAEIARTNAGSDGHFDLFVDNNLIPQTDPTDFKLIKIDLRAAVPKASLLSFLIPPVFAQTPPSPNDFVFNPIFTYIEGYAYNTTKEVIPNAVVRIKTEMAPKKIYFQKTSYKKGFFIITRPFLPIFPYSIEFLEPKTQIVYSYTTSDFAKSNKTYLDENKINLVAATKAGKPISNVSATIPNQNSQQVVSPALTSDQLSSQNSGKTIFIVLAILIIILVIVAVIFYLKRSQPNQLPPPPAPPPAI